MYNAILQIIFFTSLGVMIYILARGAMRAEENAPTAVPAKPNYFDTLIKKLPLKKIDEFINAVLEKILRKMKIVVMKADNLLNRYISKVKKTGEKNRENLPP